MTREPYRVTFAAIAMCLMVACSPRPGIGVSATAEVKGPAATLASAMQADRDFSAFANKEGVGMGEAFGTFMDPRDSYLIAPGTMTKGAEAIRAEFATWPADLTMSWEPDGGEGAASGELAVTTGRYKRTRNGAVVAEGRYVTVWKKGAEGVWKGVMDIGSPDPASAAVPPSLVEPDPNGRPG
jgi:hypothetical protein